MDEREPAYESQMVYANKNGQFIPFPHSIQMKKEHRQRKTVHEIATWINNETKIRYRKKCGKIQNAVKSLTQEKEKIFP